MDVNSVKIDLLGLLSSEFLKLLEFCSFSFHLTRVGEN